MRSLLETVSSRSLFDKILCDKIRCMAERETERILIPRFSLRWMLGLMAGCSVVSLLFSFGLRGVPWAAGLSLAIILICGCFLTYALFFAAAYGVGRVLRASVPSPPRSPFASDQTPPPQQVVPRNE